MKKKLLVSIVVALLVSQFSGLSALAADRITFLDVRSHWARADIELAVEKGIVNGYPNGTFRPDNSVTRAEFIKMLVMALNLPHSSVSVPWYQTYLAAAIETGFHDVDRDGFNDEYDATISRLEMMRIAVRAIDDQNDALNDEEYVLLAVQMGIILGKGGGNLALEDITTRAQALTVINRIVDTKAGKVLATDPLAVNRAERNVEHGVKHLALQTGHLYDIDDLSIVDEFYEMRKGTLSYDDADHLRNNIKGARDIVAGIKIDIDYENEQFVITIPEYNQEDYLIGIDTIDNWHRGPGTYVVPFEGRAENGGVYVLSVADYNIRGYGLYRHIGYSFDGVNYSYAEGTPIDQLIFGVR